jgi:uncharacterized protein YecE (DUF72 family)
MRTASPSWPRRDGMSGEGLGPVVRVGDSEVRVGTCSWADKTLVKDAAWYPKKTMSAADRLAFYAARFPVVEADSTYYRAPSEQLARGWAENSPDGFVMDVKAYSLMTGHPTKPDTLWPDIRDQLDAETRDKKNVYAHHLPDEAVDEVWHRFLEALVPLGEVGKLGAVLLQYPAWFTPKKANREELARARERLGDVPASVEFRSPLWFGRDDIDRTVRFLADHDLSLVAVDAPKVAKLPRDVHATADHVVVRFHGRADDTWSGRAATAAERFRYQYDKRELRPWAKKAVEVAKDAKEVHLLMNNCYQDFGVNNAADMIDILEDVAG